MRCDSIYQSMIDCFKVTLDKFSSSNDIFQLHQEIVPRLTYFWMAKSLRQALLINAFIKLMVKNGTAPAVIRQWFSGSN